VQDKVRGPKPWQHGSRARLPEPRRMSIRDDQNAHGDILAGDGQSRACCPAVLAGRD
jgi:hypothetical protein